MNAAIAAATCPDKRDTPQVPTDPKLCARLGEDVRRPSAFRLDVYEKKLHDFLEAKCHRDENAGWVRDKYVRDVGPWIGTFKDGAWEGKYFGTHVPVLIWYSPEMYTWLKANRPQEGALLVTEKPVPDGAIMVKEMYSTPAALCADVDPSYLLPSKDGAAIMVRDSKGSYDGWFWGWYGFGDPTWKPDYPAAASSPYPNMGFGQYCTNCHASAKHNSTFSALKNIKGQPGEPLVFLSQTFFLDPSWDSLHSRMQEAGQSDKDSAGNDPDYHPFFVKTFGIPGGPPERKSIKELPPSTYDSVWPKSGVATVAGQFVTSDQCIGCHSAGGTGLQFDMTEPGPSGKLLNISPYGTWRGSPMGLAGRDPVFFAQIASETETFNPDAKTLIEDTCLGCHGVLGQRQFAIDTKQATKKCEPFAVSMLDAIPWSSKENEPVSPAAHYSALGRDGISCTSCHHMILGKGDKEKFAGQPQNVCAEQRQETLNPGLTGFAKTFTGSFLVGTPADLYGPFKEPLHKPMQHALGLQPAHRQNIMSSEMCGSCHTVRLPILDGSKPRRHVYEQTTYPEWVFSDFRTGDSPDGLLPYGSGQQAQSCQGCHMPNKDKSANAYRSKIAAIQEYSNFPQSENTLPAKEIDLPMRAGFAKHTLVGLNVFLLKMAWQFPDILGIRKTDPMLAGKGIDPIPTAESAMLDQAVNRTATVTVADVRQEGDALLARVAVISKVGHKFPSGVGFRRAFVQFNVLDVDNNVLWSSGRTDAVGVIVDEKGTPIPGEMWWSQDCSRRLDPLGRVHQPHFQEITRQDQAQIYEELVSAPPGPGAVCGPHATPEGPLTTSFMSICAKVKDNRILPQGFLDLEKRIAIANKLGAEDAMAEEAGPTAVGDDKDYEKGGGDSLVYRVPLAQLQGKAASVQATLYYQATPPYFLQDRFCTSKSDATRRLYYLAGKLGLADTPAQHWKLRVTTSGPVSVP